MRFQTLPSKNRKTPWSGPVFPAILSVIISVTWKIKNANIVIAMSWERTPMRYKVFERKWYWRIPTGISKKKENKFPIPRNIPTKAIDWSSRVKKNTTVKWKSIVIKLKNPTVIWRFLRRFPERPSLAEIYTCSCIYVLWKYFSLIVGKSAFEARTFPEFLRKIFFYVRIEVYIFISAYEP